MAIALEDMMEAKRKKQQAIIISPNRPAPQLGPMSAIVSYLSNAILQCSSIGLISIRSR